MLRLLSIFKQEESIEEWMNIFANVLLELLPSITPDKGLILINAGISYLEKIPVELNSQSLKLLNDNLESIDILCGSELLPKINPELFRKYAIKITQWIETTFSEDIALLNIFTGAFEQLQEHRRYTGSTPAHPRIRKIDLIEVSNTKSMPESKI